MRKILSSFLLALFSVTAYAQITIGGGTTSNLMPVSTQYGFTYSQQIMPQPGIGAAAAGNITGLTFYLPVASSIANSNNWTVYLGHTTKGSFTTTSDWIPVTTLTQVFSGTVTVVNGEVNIVFTTPFAYNNTENLVIAVDENGPGNEGSNLFYNYSGGSNTVIYYRNDLTNPDPNSPPAGSRTATKSVVTLQGLTVAAAPSCPSVTAPANNATGVSTLPTFTWGLSQNAAGYRITLGTTPGGTDILNNVDLGNTNSYTLATALNNNTQYYYTVSAYNAAGSSTSCTERSFTTMAPAPANDDCSSVALVTVSPFSTCATVVSGTTLNATASTDALSPCTGSADDDVWYSFIATGPEHIVSLSNIVSVGTTTTTTVYLQVLSGTCGALTSIACDTTDATPTFLTGLTTGQMYYVRVYTSLNGPQYAVDFDLCISTVPPAPVNDECAGAITLTVNPDGSCAAVLSGNTLSATNSGTAAAPCTGNPDDDIWYSFTALSTSHYVQLSNVASTGSSSSTTLYMQIFSGGCAGMNSLACSTNRLAVLNGLTPGQIYLVRVYSSLNGTNYSQSFDICVGTVPPPPANDDCANATSLTVNPSMSCGVITAGSTAWATDSGVLSTCTGTEDDDVWYTFTATSANHAVQLNNVVSVGATSSTTLYMEILSGSCSGLTSMVCSTNYIANLSGLTIGQTYYVRVYSSGTGSNYAQTFEICVTTPPTNVPANDDCANAIVIPSFPYNFTQHDGINATNNAGNITTCSTSNDGLWYTFTGDGGNVTITTTTTTPWNQQLNVYTGSCGAFTCADFSDSSSNGTGNVETVTISTTPGTTYFINVSYFTSTAGDEGNFNISVTSDVMSTSETSVKPIAVYPNPFTDILTITDVKNMSTIHILDSSGRNVKMFSNPSSELNLSDLKTGLYILRIKYKNGLVKSVKVIKK